MKKFILLVLSMMLLACLVGCSTTAEDYFMEESKAYTITYNYNDGVRKDKKVYVFLDNEYNLGTPTREDYTFVCWECNGKKFEYSGTWNIAENIDLVAKWRSNWTAIY